METDVRAGWYLTDQGMRPGGTAVSSGTATAGRLIGRALSFLAQLVLARALAPEAFGVFAIAWTTLRLFAIVGHLGLDAGVIRFGAEALGHDPRRLKGAVLLAVGGALLAGSVFGLVIFLSAPWIAASAFGKPELEPILRGFAFVFPLAATLRVLAAASSLSGRMLCGAIAEDLLQPVAQMAVFLPLFWVGLGLKAAVMSTAVSYGASVAMGVVCVRRLLPETRSAGSPDLTIFRSLLRFSLPTDLAVSLGAFNVWGDRLLVGYFGTASQAGIYQSVSLISVLTTLMMSGIKSASAPILARMLSAAQGAAAVGVVQRAARWGLYIATPILLLTAFLPGEILIALFGPAYTGGATALVWLAAGQFLYVAVGVADQFILMSGHQALWLAITGFSFIATLVLDAFAIPAHGIVGAAVVSCGTTALTTALTILLMRRLTGQWLVGWRQLLLLVSAIISGALAMAATNVSGLQSTERAWAAGSSAIVLLGLAMWVFVIDPQDRRLIRQWFSQIRPS